MIPRDADRRLCSEAVFFGFSQTFLKMSELMLKRFEMRLMPRETLMSELVRLGFPSELLLAACSALEMAVEYVG